MRERAWPGGGAREGRQGEQVRGNEDEGADHIDVDIAPGSGVLGVQLCLGVGGRRGMQDPAVFPLPLSLAPSMA